MISKSAWVTLPVTVVALALTDATFTHLTRAPAFPSGQHPFRVRSAVYDHGLRPNYSGVDRWGPYTFTYFTNSLGFRDREPRTIDLISHQKRLLLLGDSFTEGLGLDFPKTFAGLLAVQLKPCRTEVLNAAVTSYAPTVYLRKTQYLIDQIQLRVDEVAVLVDISDIEDETFYGMDDTGVVTYSRPESESHPVVRFVRARFSFPMLWDTLQTFWASRLPGGDPRRRPYPWAVDLPRARWTISDSEWQQYGEAGVKQALARMTQLKEYLAAKRIPLVVAIYPWPDQVLNRDLDSRQVRIWTDWSREHGVPLLNLFPRFIDLTKDPRLSLDRYFLGRDVHWSEAGHSEVARAFLAYYQPACRVQ